MPSTSTPKSIHKSGPKRKILSNDGLTLDTDVLVLGSGSAGLFFALQVAMRSKLRVLVLTKKERSESNTNYAQGGIASVVDPTDSFDAHVRDTLIAGAGLCHRDAVEALVHEGPKRIRELIELGTRFTKSRGGKLDLGREGGHSANRIIHARDLTGREIERALLAAVEAQKNITVLEDHFAIELLTDHQRIPTTNGKIATRPGKSKLESRQTCYGAYVLHELSGVVKTARARVAVMLATGGTGCVYLHTTNPSIATGDGVAMAYRAGAQLANMEFIQFHPTTLYAPEAHSFLISEAVRGAGGVLRNLRGERFMTEYDPERMELAPRDIVARAIDFELKKSGDPYVELDVSHLNATKIKHEFPNIYARCKEIGIDITKDPIPVVPAAHYSCGGVVTDLCARTSIDRLYASGEVAMTGVHGANRLASNSLLESLVFAQRASDDLLKSLKAKVLVAESVEIMPWDDTDTEKPEEWVVIAHDAEEIRQLMWDYVGIVRTTYRLRRAERRLKLIRREIEEYYSETRVSVPLLELRNIADVALLIVQCALKRKESRGLHYTTDFPKTDNHHWLHDTTILKGA